MLPQLATAEVLNYKKLTPLASKILHRILYRIIVLIPDRDSRSIKTYKTSTSCLRNTMQNTTQNHTANPSGRQQKYYNIQNWHLLLQNTTQSSRILHRILHRILRRILHRLLRRILGRILTG